MNTFLVATLLVLACLSLSDARPVREKRGLKNFFNKFKDVASKVGGGIKDAGEYILDKFQTVGMADLASAPARARDTRDVSGAGLFQEKRFLKDSFNKLKDDFTRFRLGMKVLGGRALDKIRKANIGKVVSKARDALGDAARAVSTTDLRDVVEAVQGVMVKAGGPVLAIPLKAIRDAVRDQVGDLVDNFSDSDLKKIEDTALAAAGV